MEIEYKSSNSIEDRFKNDQWGIPRPYQEEDLLTQELFGIKYFNWLSFWEQHHIVTKYKLCESLITKRI